MSQNPLIKAIATPAQSRSAFMWATVTQQNPLLIRLDGEIDPMEATPDLLVDPLSLTVGSRVWVQFHEKTLVVLGRSAGDPVLPAMVTSNYGSGYTVASTTTWAVPTNWTARSFVAPAPVLVDVIWGCWINTVVDTSGRARLAWSGALNGNTYDNQGGWVASLHSNEDNYISLERTQPLVLPAGTTNFTIETVKTGTGTVSVNYGRIIVIPRRWA